MLLDGVPHCPGEAGEHRIVLPDGRSHAKSFDLDLARCMFCGLCEEVCPVAAIVMTRFYEGSTHDKRDSLLDKQALMANQVYASKEVFVQPASGPAGEGR